jgi:hypothetical protein
VDLVDPSSHTSKVASGTCTLGNISLVTV